MGDFVERIYHIELEIKDTTDTERSGSYLDLHLEIDSDGRSVVDRRFEPRSGQTKDYNISIW